MIRELKDIAARYKLEIAGLNVDVPYWINWSTPPYFLNAPYRGKGYPGQIRYATERALTLCNERLDSAGAMRIFMKRQGLGIDCSGFVYRVLDGYLQQYGRRLADYLIVHPSELQAAQSRHPNRPTLPVKDELTPLSLVARTWKKDPAVITSVERLTDPMTATFIPTTQAIQRGDLIKMTSSNGDHVALVWNVSPKFIDYVAAEEEAAGLGGVRYHRISITEPTQPLQEQTWSQRKIFNPSQNGDGVWRLAALQSIDEGAACP